VYVPVLVTVLPFAVISFIVYCAVLAKVTPETVMLKVCEPPLRIEIDATLGVKAAGFESIHAEPEFIVTVAEPVF
jgi:hypothetical protein